jgi:hypothetical protein
MDWLALDAVWNGQPCPHPDGEQIDGRVSRVEEPRTIRFGVKYNF